jgi:predicted transcriptional regulator
MAKKEEKETTAALHHRSPEGVVIEDGPPVAPLEQTPEAKKQAKRVADVQARLKDAPIPDSMKAYMLMQNLSDEEIDAMEKDWKAGRVVRHGSSEWGEAKA